MTAAELDLKLQAMGVDAATMEHQFHPERKWRFDLAWPEFALAVELHGFGRHIRVQGFINDRDKMNAAILEGWRVLEFTPRHWTQAATDESIETILRAMGWKFEDVH